VQEDMGKAQNLWQQELAESFAKSHETSSACHLAVLIKVSLYPIRVGIVPSQVTANI
jgi:hypothetical protein